MQKWYGCVDMNPAESVLHYVADPMCSWCWGFKDARDEIFKAIGAAGFDGYVGLEYWPEDDPLKGLKQVASWFAGPGNSR